MSPTERATGNGPQRVSRRMVGNALLGRRKITRRKSSFSGQPLQGEIKIKDLSPCLVATHIEEKVTLRGIVIRPPIVE
jgi:hypothetical protein